MPMQYGLLVGEKHEVTSRSPPIGQDFIESLEEDRSPALLAVYNGIDAFVWNLNLSSLHEL
jgi:hypothetical protein